MKEALITLAFWIVMILFWEGVFFEALADRIRGDK